MSSFTLPIYYDETFKTKPTKTWLVGDNAFRNWHFHLKNKVKRHYHTLVAAHSSSLSPITGQFTLDIAIYYKNPSMDGSNVASRMEKFSLDALQELGIITNDNIQFHIGSTWHIAGQDKLYPRCQITILPLKDPND